MAAASSGAIVMAVALVGVGAGPSCAAHYASGTANPSASSQAGDRTSSALAQKKGKPGRLRVLVNGAGSYAIKGKGTCAVAGTSRSYRLAPGKYTVEALGAELRPATVNVRSGKQTPVRVSFTGRLPKGAVQRVSANSAGIPANGESRSPAWSPDGTRIAFISTATNLAKGPAKGGLFVKTLSTGRVERLAAFPPDRSTLPFDGVVFWSPDGTRIAFVSKDANLVQGDMPNTSDVFVVSLNSGEIIRASVDDQGRPGGNRADSYDPAWSPDGTRLAFVSDQLVPEDPSLGGPDLYVKDLTTGAVQMIATGKYYGASYGPAWAPDGDRIAWDQSGIQVRELASGATTLAVADSEAADPVWSPDGTRIAYSVGWDVSAVTLGSGRRELVTPRGWVTFGQRWTPNGSGILMNGGPQKTGVMHVNDVFVRDLGSRKITVLSTNSQGQKLRSKSYSKPPTERESASEGSVSPDGRRVAFTTMASNVVPCNSDPHRGDAVFVKTLS